MLVFSAGDEPRLDGGYVHCSKCLSESGNETYSQSIEVLYSGGAVQVWCREHGCNIATFRHDSARANGPPGDREG